MNDRHTTARLALRMRQVHAGDNPNDAPIGGPLIEIKGGRATPA
jgi:hypothetical protein